jgi:N-acetylglucosamine-6-phosphate deacetylase
MVYRACSLFAPYDCRIAEKPEGIVMRLSSWVLLLLLLSMLPSIGHGEPTSRPLQGLKENAPDLQALTGARIVISPGKEIEKGTVLIRGRSIIAVGARIKVPATARVIDLTGKTVYAGFIDSYGEVDIPAGVKEQGASHWNPLVTPQLDAGDDYQADTDLDKTLRSQGLTIRLVAPSTGILKGTSALVTTGEDLRHHAVLATGVAQHGRLTVPRGRGRDNYPNSPMGAVALARQTFHDVAWNLDAWKAYRADRTLARPERNDALVALEKTSTGKQVIILDAPNEQYFLRADRFAREFSLQAVIRGSGREYRRLAAIRKTGRSVIVPLDFPRAPNVGTSEAAMDVSLEELMHWDLAPENPARLAREGVNFVFTSHGLAKRGEFLERVQRAVARGLDEQAALGALTTGPARLLGIQQLAGTVEPGKLANLVVSEGSLFQPGATVEETWVSGKRYRVAEPPERIEVAGQWRLSADALTGKEKYWLLEITAEGKKLSGKLYQDTKPNDKQVVKFTRLSQRDARVSGLLPAGPFDREGFVQLTLVVTEKDGKAIGTGHWTWPDGTQLELSALDQGSTGKKQVEKKAGEGKEKPVEASFAVNYPLGAFGTDGPAAQPQVLVIRNATIWTSGPAGVLENASMLVRAGRIVAVGREVVVPAGAVVIDATGKHVSAGIIDCHSHFATDGGVNESTQAITAEVRIGDFIDANDVTIYRHLAGGVTCSNILHGSANPIGGQNQVVKLRWGLLDEELKFSEAPAGIKFALGENVKQSNWGDEYTTRYPQTRMGVEQIIRDGFQRAIQYRQDWTDWKKTGKGIPPRHDLELEALAEIVEGKRWIHCHSYRQDEILALLRTLEDFDIQIGTFQHILEGYKVADAMARHGAMGSAFSDWWAYKIEVYDAIPYNGALMHEAGVVVSFNSDDRELARHLNHEAAKAVKYGGVAPGEALKFVTLNPARQLRIDRYVGSLEVGKHADFVIWSGSPLSVFARCEQTWIDGRRYFAREQDIRFRQQRDQRRAALIQKILLSGEVMLTAGESATPDEDLWPREDIFCHHHDHGHGLHDQDSRNRLDQLRMLLERQE